MKITNLIIENFMSVGLVETSMNDKGLVLIQGDNTDDDSFESNGAGKSTIFSESIVWGLFGKTIRGVTGDDVVNRQVKKNTAVIITLQDGDSEYQVSRYRKHVMFKNKVQLHHNGKNITAKSDNDTTEMIENILQMDYLSFTNSIMFGQGLTKMFASSTDSEQKKILERMLEISVFQECQDIAKDMKSSTQLTVNELTNSLESITSKHSSKSQTLQDLQDKEAELGNTIDQRIEGLKEDIKSYEEYISNLTTELEGLEEDAEILGEAVRVQQEKVDGYADIEKRYTALEYKESTISSNLNRIENDMLRVARQIKEAEQGINLPEVCSKCGQKINSKVDKQHIIDHLNEKLEKLAEDNSDLNDELEKLYKDMAPLKRKLKHLPNNKEVLREYKTAEAETVKAISPTKYAIKSYEDKIEVARKQIAEQEEQRSKTYSDLIEKAINDLRELDAQGAKVEEQLRAENERLSMIEFWINAYGNQGIKSNLLDSVVPYLNTRANYYLGKLAGSSIEVKFSTQELVKSTGKMKDKFKVEVINKNGDANYKGNSGGEKRRTDIAINMALQDLVQSRSNKRLDLIVYDEMWEGLDAVGCESAIELLREKASEFGSVFVITHDDYLQKLFNKSVTVTKSDGRTVLLGEVK